MKCPTLRDLPEPASGRSGWPWTVESDAPAGSGSKGFPKISIVTPSYNQADFLEATIRSVLLQGYPNLEYIIMDGGSSDDSVSTIRRYERWLEHWESKSDRGQSHAINKGWSRATGSIISYVNSDDILLPGALHRVKKTFAEDSELGLAYGDAQQIAADGSYLKDRRSRPLEFSDALAKKSPIRQPAAFIARQVIDEVGLLDESLHATMDYEFWLRIAVSRYPARYLEGSYLAAMRKHDQMKGQTLQREMNRETIRVLNNLRANLGEDASYEMALRRKLATCWANLSWMDVREGDRWRAFVEMIRSLALYPRSMPLRGKPLRWLVEWILGPDGMRAGVRTKNRMRSQTTHPPK